MKQYNENRREFIKKGKVLQDMENILGEVMTCWKKPFIRLDSDDLITCILCNMLNVIYNPLNCVSGCESECWSCNHKVLSLIPGTRCQFWEFHWPTLSS